MTHHHDPKSTRVFNAPQKKPADSFQWDLDQEMRDHIARVKLIMSTSPTPTSSKNGGGVGVGVGGDPGLVCNKDLDIDSPPTHTHPPVVPPLSSSQMSQEQLCKALEWLKKKHITCTNYLLKKYSPDEILGAIEDYDAALASGYVIHSPTGFFRRLLEPVSPDRKQPPPPLSQLKNNDPDKYIKGKYGHMVQR